MSNTAYQHSKARVPRLYKEAGKIVQKVKEEGGSLKTLVHEAKHPNHKALHALVAETLRHASELDTLLRQTQILVKEQRLDPWVTRVLMTELLWRQRPLNGDAMPLKIVQSYKSEFLAKQAALGTNETQPVTASNRPRFMRVNTLKATEQEITHYFTHEGWEELNPLQHNGENHDKKYADFLNIVSSLSDGQFLHDEHIPNLLVFPGNVQFYNIDYYHNGGLILQDKASCMSGHLLNPPPGSTVLDMCAAPGMKTTHIAAILNNLGTVYAIEKNERRYESLCQVVSQTEATCVKPILGDALHFSDKDLPDVEYILVDPTCSGSGMITRKEIFNDSDSIAKDRLEKLSNFQSLLLRHAMTNFPKAKRIVYSTCSVCPEENEAVVDDVLKNAPPNFMLTTQTNGTSWMKKGSSSYQCGDSVLYANRDVDMTNGFFVAVFERTENEYVPGKLITKEIPAENRKKTKQSKKNSNNVEGLTSEKPSSTDLHLERMRRAMQNCSAAIETDSSENPVAEENKSRKREATEKESEDSEQEQEIKKKKKKQEKDDSYISSLDNGHEVTKKKKKVKHDAERADLETVCYEVQYSKCKWENDDKVKEKLKKKVKHDADSEVIDSENSHLVKKKKKSKHDKVSDKADADSEVADSENSHLVKKKKKSKHDKVSDDGELENIHDVKQKKSQIVKNSEEADAANFENDSGTQEVKKKKKKKKMKNDEESN